MSNTLILFVHGAPDGQKIRALRNDKKIQEDERLYIETFYGRKKELDLQLFVDVVQNGNNVNCYYTYLRSGNILDGANNRPGSYFALTVKVNKYYADIPKLYHVLDAAYSSYVLGTILKKEGTTTKYIVRDFEPVSTQLETMDKEIESYLGSFSISSDFISLEGFTTNSNASAVAVNLYDYDRETLLAHLKNQGKLCASPLYPTKQLTALAQDKKNEIEGIKRLAEKELLEVSNKAKQDAEAAKKEHQSLKESLEKEIQSLKAQSISDGTKSQGEYNKLKQQLSSKENELAEANRGISTIKQILTSVKAPPASPPPNVEPIPVKHPQRSKLAKYTPLITILNFVLILALLGYTIFNNPSPNIEQVAGEQLANNPEIILPPPIAHPEPTPIVEDTVGSPGVSARIDIQEFKTDTSYMKKGKVYHISIKPARTDGEWVYGNFISKNEPGNLKTITAPLNAGKFTIEYTVAGKVIASRSIDVK